MLSCMLFIYFHLSCILNVRRTIIACTTHQTFLLHNLMRVECEGLAPLCPMMECVPEPLFVFEGSLRNLTFTEGVPNFGSALTWKHLSHSSVFDLVSFSITFLFLPFSPSLLPLSSPSQVRGFHSPGYCLQGNVREQWQ